MRYLIALLLFAFSFSLCHAEKKRKKEKDEIQFNSVKLYFGDNYTSHLNIDENYNSFYHGFTLGVNYTVWIKKTYILVTGLQLSRLSYLRKTHEEEDTLYRGWQENEEIIPERTITAKNHSFYLSIPVNYKYYFSSSLYVRGGTSIDFYLYDKILSKTSIEGDDADHLDVKRDNHMKDFKIENISMGGNLAFGKIFPYNNFLINLEIEAKIYSAINFYSQFDKYPYYAGIKIGIEYPLDD